MRMGCSLVGGRIGGPLRQVQLDVSSYVEDGVNILINNGWMGMDLLATFKNFHST
jgi:hypothetical protein